MTAPNSIPEDVCFQANMVLIKILPISENIYSDQTGKPPVIFIRVRKYTMVMVDYKSEAILADPLTSRA